MTNRQIPYVIIEAHPDYKRPYALPEFNVVEETKLHSRILDRLVDFVYEQLNMETVTTVKDIEMFWDNYYSGSYMSMTPWQATAFIRGEWEDICISNEELLDALLKTYKKQKEDDEKEDDEKEDDEKEDDEKEEEEENDEDNEENNAEEEEEK
jgi:hypothetical protein